MQNITPNLWFDNKAEEAAKFYVSIFKNSKMGTISRYDEEAAKHTGRPAGSAMLVTFQLSGQDFMALNGGPMFKFSEAVSFVINCEDQDEVDYFWEKLTGGGGEESMCGWLKDQFGLSWQVVPTALGELMTSGTAEQSRRVMNAMLQMRKIDIQKLQDAFDGKEQAGASKA
jgi:predicted 3-demethylubiquinone-9 3-methyltransferase (glyoxalase superfamily)